MSDQWVYFIQADENGPIKIGFTSGKPERRLNQLQTAHPSALKLLGAISGTSQREKQFHTELAQWRLQGEWFESHPKVLGTIADALAAEETKPEQHPINCGGFHCSFCDACQHDSIVLIAGPGDIFICDQCIGLCAVLAGQALDKKGEAIMAGPPSLEMMGYGG